MTTSTPIFTISPRPGRQQHRRRWRVVLVGVVTFLVAAAVVAGHVTLGYYAELPGQAQPVTALVTVPRGRAHHLRGTILLTDIAVASVNALEYVPDELSSTTTLVPTSVLTGGLPAREFDLEGTVDMEEAQMTAEAVALRQLGYPVPERDGGVTLYAIIPGTPAYHSLHVGDVVTAVDGVPTLDPPALVAAIGRYRPGQSVTLSIGSVTDPAATHPVTVRLGSQRRHGALRPVLGIPYSLSAGSDGMGTQAVYSMPLHLAINSDGIGGPSAGLALTLGLLDRLGGGDLTGGRVVAATGTIDPNGAVGEIGGLPQKTVAVERAHASVFLVPAAQAAVARAHATPGLQVIGVRSLSQALSALRRLGGHLGAAAAGPVPGPDGHSVPADWSSSPWS
ncbi:MAG: PDZ domain-containing protein [Actinomycetota bacterium]|jgi:PDZ domain-containing protein|nr:PDZ domain-containing protein [Actinomycetota bacterium]